MSVVSELKAILHNLEALTSGSSVPQAASAGPKYPPLTAFDAIVKEF